MSNQYLYKCPQCDYSIYTDDNGCECTFRAISYLYFCEDCHILAKHVAPAPFTESEWDDEWDYKGSKVITFSSGISPSEIKTVKDEKQPLNDVHCPTCGSPNIHKWNPISCGCPKCGGKMIQIKGRYIHTD